MPRPRRCNVREGDHHRWEVHGDRFVCIECKEPGPDICDAMLDLWDARTVGKQLPLDERRDLLVAMVGRAEMVLEQFETQAALIEAECAAAEKEPGPEKPPVGWFG